MPILGQIAKPAGKKASGTIIITGPGGEQQAETIQCVHCMKHWIMVKGSRIERGWCTICEGPICGRACAVCNGHWKKKLDAVDGG